MAQQSRPVACPSSAVTFVALTTLVAAACTGNIADGGASSGLDQSPGGGSSAGGSGARPGGGNGAGGDTGPGTPEACSARAVDVGPTPLRRLTRSQYDNTVAALLGDTSGPARAFAPDETLLGFAAGLSVSPLLAEQYQGAAEKLAAAAVVDLPKLLGCDPKTGEDACAHAFIDRFGQRAYRRPLAADERTDLRALYATEKASGGFTWAVEAVVQAVLQSPGFLYRIERGTATDRPGVVRLGGYELASRLAYFLWNTMPDDALFAAAASGKLDDPKALEAEVKRMLADKRVSGSVRDFFGQWLALDGLGSIGKDSKLYPGFDDKMRAAMRDETLRFSEHVVLEGDAKLETLYRAPFGFVNATLAPIYGMTGVTGDALTKRDLPAGQRHGLLTQASVLSLHAKTNQSSPVSRGAFVREQLFCQTLQPPPPNLVVEAPDPDPSLPTRVRFAEHSKNPACAGCHKLLDPIGFGFESYDAVGRHRTMDGNVAVDARGELFATDVDGAFEGVAGLSEKLVASAEARACFAGKWFVFALGRSHTNENDACAVAGLERAFEASGHDVRSLIVALTTSEAFRHARTDTGGL